jgi:hypothetical protein
MATGTVIAEERKSFDALVTVIRDTFPELMVEPEATAEHPAAALALASTTAQLLVVVAGAAARRGMLLGSVSPFSRLMALTT